jgi:hypothetical protein
MRRPRVAVLLIPVFLSAGSVRADDGLFAPDPQHPWNRLHRFFYVRTYGDKKTFAYDGLEAPLGRVGSFLTADPSHKEALTLLDDFIKADADKLIHDPLKRALMQRDLWYVFDKLAETSPATLEFEEEPADRQSRRRDVERRLARVMRRLELSEKEVRALPDNYADALKSAKFPAAFDPREPDRPFLPADLLVPDSPWVMVSRHYSRGIGLAAPDHVEKTGSRALFSVLFRHPGGAKEAKEYVARLRPGQGAPRLPDGALFALLRQTVLVNDRGALQATRFTESLEIRTFPSLKDQHFYEWVLDRKALLDGKAGGLRARSADDGDLFALGFGPGFVDPFERGTPPEVVRPLRACTGCHSREGGILSVNTFGSHLVGGWQGADLTDRPTQIRQTLDPKRLSYSWGLLQGLREAR